MKSCHFCESTADIEEHHIVPQRFDGSDAETNLVDLCHDCHWKLERLYNKDFWEAIGIDDPRSTQESHVTCHYSGCTNKATDSYSVTAHTGQGLTLRCPEHSSRSNSDSREIRGEPTRNPDDLSKWEFVLEVEFNRKFADECPTREQASEALSRIDFPSYDRVKTSDADSKLDLVIINKRPDSFRIVLTDDGWEAHKVPDSTLA